MALQSHIDDRASGTQVLLSAAQGRGQVLHLQLRIIVVFVRDVSDSPEQTGRRRFGARLEARFCSPLLPCRIMDIELWTGAVQVLSLELDRKLGLMIFAAGSPEEILRTDVARVAPEDGLLGCGEYCGEQNE